MELEDSSNSPLSLNSTDFETLRKRNRSSNFSSHEKNLLIHILEKHQEIIESKRNDRITLLQKDKIWEHVRKEFNELSMTTPARTTKQLKVCYDNLKRKIRKEARPTKTAVKSENETEELKNSHLEQQQPATDSVQAEQQQPPTDGDSEWSISVPSSVVQVVSDSSRTMMSQYRRNKLYNGMTEARKKGIPLCKLRRILLMKEIRLANLCIEMQRKKSNLELQVEEAKLQYYQKKIKMFDNKLNNVH